MSMEGRVAILETLAAQISATLTEMRKEAQEFRAEMRADLRNVQTETRSDLRNLQTELRTEIRDLRRVHDRDFRITFGAIITTTLGLAALIAHIAHWI